MVCVVPFWSFLASSPRFIADARLLSYITIVPTIRLGHSIINNFQLFLTWNLIIDNQKWDNVLIADDFFREHLYMKCDMQLFSYQIVSHRTDFLFHIKRILHSISELSSISVARAICNRMQHFLVWVISFNAFLHEFIFKLRWKWEDLRLKSIEGREREKKKSKEREKKPKRKENATRKKNKRWNVQSFKMAKWQYLECVSSIDCHSKFFLNDF